MPNDKDNLDAFFAAADSKQRHAMRRAAHKAVDDESAPSPDSLPRPQDGSKTQVLQELTDTVLETNEPTPLLEEGEQFDDLDTFKESIPRNTKAMEGKFIAIDPDSLPGSSNSDEPFVLVPAHIHNYLPWWGWLTIVLGLMVLVAGVLLMPAVSLDRLVDRLGDRNEANAQRAMRQLVIKGDERTVKKLFGMATSDRAPIDTRLRAVDTMSLIERVPEVDRALLRLELSNETDKQVREAATAARKQREAYRTRGRR